MNPIMTIEYLGPLLVLGLVLIVLSSWRGSRGCATRARVLLVGLRIAAFAILSLVALNLGAWRVQQRRGDSEWVVLVDSSASMTTEDVDGQSRWERALELAKRAVDADTDTRSGRVYAFDRGLRPGPLSLAQLVEQAPDGPATELGSAGVSLLDSYDGSGVTLDGILLLSDGRQTGSGDVRSFALRALGRAAPIHVCPLGGQVEQRDLEMTTARRQHVRFPSQALKLRGRVANRAMGDVRATVHLETATGERLAEQTIDVPQGERRAFSFEVPDSSQTYAEYVLSVDPWAGESNTHNNKVRVGVSRLEKDISVLLLEGEPHWDSKFLAQFLRRQPHMQVTTVHRVAGDRYFQVSSAGVEGEVADTVFPPTVQALRAYDVVVFGKGAEYFVDDRAASHLEQYVRRHGGTVLFARGKPYHTDFPALARLEPVEWGGAIRGQWRWLPTEGDDSGLYGDALPGRDDTVWHELSPVSRSSVCRRLKPFSLVLVEGVPDVGEKTRTHPLVVARRVGSGMVMTINAEGLWQWDFFPRFEGSGDLYKKMWVETVQWLTTRGGFLPGRGMALRLGASHVPPDSPVKAALSFRVAAPESSPELSIQRPDGTTLNMQPRRTDESGLQYEAVFVPHLAGDYRVAARSGDDTAQAVLSVDAPPGELDNRSADPALLAELAELSGGSLVASGDIAEVVKGFTAKQESDSSGVETWHPAWDRVWLLLLLAATLLAEWIVRRRRGLL